MSSIDAEDALQLLAEQPSGASVPNMMFVGASFLLGLWAVRLLRQFYLLHKLNIAIKTEQVVRLQTTDLGPHERSMFFGEIEMLWRTNLQQQLLRARRISTALDVTQLQVPFQIDKNTLTMVYHDSRRTVGLDFKFQATERIALQVYWHVASPALKELLARFNHVPAASAATRRAGGIRRVYWLFGQRYMPVSMGSGGTPGGDSGPDRSRSYELPAVSPPDDTGRTQALLFQDAQCCARSGVVALRETQPQSVQLGDACSWGHFDSPEPVRVRAARLHECGHAVSPVGAEGSGQCPAPSPRGMPQEGEDSVAAQAAAPASTERGATDAYGAEEGRGPGHSGPGGAATRNTLTVVIAAKPLGQLESTQPADSTQPAALSATASNAVKNGESVTLVLIVAQEKRSGSGEPRLEVARQVVVTSRAAYVSQEIYGEEDEEAGDSEECVICFCEPKDTTLLPCRHLCVCRECFARLENCPVCRSPFIAYLRKPATTSPADDAAGETEADDADPSAVAGLNSPQRAVPGGE